MIITQRRSSRIIPIAGGKGGVGKTEVCANLGICLAKLGFKTLVIDLDLGGSNLHSTLGMKNRNIGLGNYLSDRDIDFESIIVHTPYPNLHFIPGDVLVAGTPNISFTQKQSIIGNIEKLEHDYILLDLGSGASNNIADFFLISNSGIIVTAPHTGSLLNAYSLLKNTVFRFLIRAFSGETMVEKYLRAAIKERRPGNPATIANIFSGISDIDSNFYAKAKRYLLLLQPLVILNSVRNASDLESIEKLRDLTSNNLDIFMETLGMLVYDDDISQHRYKTPIIDSSPDSLFSIEIERIAQKIIQSPDFPQLALARELYPDSYALMHIESASDLELLEEQKTAQELQMQKEKMEFVEIINKQNKKINELKNAVRMLSIGKPPI